MSKGVVSNILRYKMYLIHIWIVSFFPKNLQVSKLGSMWATWFWIETVIITSLVQRFFLYKLIKSLCFLVLAVHCKEKKEKLWCQKQPVYLCVPLLLMFLLIPPSCETLPRGRRVQIRAAVVWLDHLNQRRQDVGRSRKKLLVPVPDSLQGWGPQGRSRHQPSP